MAEFSKSQRSADGRQTSCKLCYRAYYQKNKKTIIGRTAQYRKDNKESVAEYFRQRYKDNKVAIDEFQKEYYKLNKKSITNYKKKYYEKNKEAIEEYGMQYRKKNKKEIACRMKKYNKVRRDNDPAFRIEHTLRNRMRAALNGRCKADTTKALLGCTYKEACAHIEAQFTEGMSWDKMGIHGIHIDHIRPCASFDLTDPEQQRECFHYTNLQPLWAKDNLRKSDKW